MVLESGPKRHQHHRESQRYPISLLKTSKHSCSVIPSCTLRTYWQCRWSWTRQNDTIDQCETHGQYPTKNRHDNGMQFDYSTKHSIGWTILGANHNPLAMIISVTFHMELLNIPFQTLLHCLYIKCSTEVNTSNLQQSIFMYKQKLPSLKFSSDCDRGEFVWLKFFPCLRHHACVWQTV